MQGRRTGHITVATAIEVGGILLMLAALIGWVDVIGATAAAIAFLSGRLGGNLYLVKPCANQLISRSPVVSDR